MFDGKVKCHDGVAALGGDISPGRLVSAFRILNFMPNKAATGNSGRVAVKCPKNCKVKGDNTVATMLTEVSMT